MIHTVNWISCSHQMSKDLDSLKIDPIIVHLVIMNGPEWSDPVTESGGDSKLWYRVIEVVTQIMDLDLSKESDKDQDEILLHQDEEHGPGGPEVILQSSPDVSMRSGINEFYVWLDQGNKDHAESMVESDERESNTYTTVITPGEGILEGDTWEERCHCD